MIANALRDDIDLYAARMKTINPIFFRAQDGTLGRQAIAYYLANVRVLLQSTPRHLAYARVAARSRGDAALAAHFTKKLGEEVGHDVWAEQDLATLAAEAETAGDSAGGAMHALIGWIERVIDEDPGLYLGYILFAEYLIVLLGPEWLALLESRCHIPKSSMTVIGNHVELDRDHVEEAMDEIDRLVNDPGKLRRMREVVAEATQYFDRFCADVCEHGDRVQAA